MKKKLLAFLLGAAMIFSLSGCAADTTEESSSETAGTDNVTSAPTTEATEDEASATEIDMSGVKLINDGTLTIGVEIGYPPFEDFAEDGTTPVGYDIDFANALGEKLGVKVNFVNTAWDGNLPRD